MNIEYPLNNLVYQIVKGYFRFMIKTYILSEMSYLCRNAQPLPSLLRQRSQDMHSAGRRSPLCQRFGRLFSRMSGRERPK